MTTSRPVNLMVTLRPRPSTASRLKEVLLTLSNDVKKHEHGCLSYQVWEYETEEKSKAFVLVENWASQEAFDNHHKQPHLRKADKIIEDEGLLSEKEEDRFMSPVGGFMQR
ncbi:hypothetical protein DL95DRAFT_442371 [Leptodontidium sp. 2 PMI_412]|nr:hypothetical protein BKA61DRAFT_603906 [Leptodontidium sp. MPI-SDFR-AT-0119]KAH9221183.1 hypothetical protein DL95DRAFT_442371 [Leptodontidium sp. 2 PMI_412]